MQGCFIQNVNHNLLLLRVTTGHVISVFHLVSTNTLPAKPHAHLVSFRNQGFIRYQNIYILLNFYILYNFQFQFVIFPLFCSE